MTWPGPAFYRIRPPLPLAPQARGPLSSIAYGRYGIKLLHGLHSPPCAHPHQITFILPELPGEDEPELPGSAGSCRIRYVALSQQQRGGGGYGGYGGGGGSYGGGGGGGGVGAGGPGLLSLRALSEAGIKAADAVVLRPPIQVGACGWLGARGCAGKVRR